MELYKFINDACVKEYKGGFVILDDRIYTNPTDEVVKKAGYKPLARVAVPEYDVFTEYLKVTYTELEDIIVPSYTVIRAETVGRL